MPLPKQKNAYIELGKTEDLFSQKVSTIDNQFNLKHSSTGSRCSISLDNGMIERSDYYFVAVPAEGEIKNMIIRNIPTSNGKSFQLRWPIHVKIKSKGDYVFASNNDFDISTCGSNEEECLRNFYDLFEHMKKHYCEAPDNKLMGVARRLKALFTNIVE